MKRKSKKNGLVTVCIAAPLGIRKLRQIFKARKKDIKRHNIEMILMRQQFEMEMCLKSN